LLVALLGLAAGQAAAVPDPGFLPKKSRSGVGASTGQRLIFPVLGPSRYGNSFGDRRGNGRHEGIDIMAPKRALALAAEAGRVRFHATSARAGCMLYLRGRSGTEYLYVHLNNDVTSGNDNRGRCVAGTAYAPGLRNGASVVAGQPIGFVGDSGDANGVAPHLHFELHPRGGAAVNPFTQLNRAWRLLFAAPPNGDYRLRLEGSALANPTSVFRVNVQRLLVTTTGLRVNGLRRPVSLGVNALTRIETAVTRVSPGTRPAMVWTEIAPVTLDAQLGKPGAITAERIVLSR
jgi:hypothetical protein